MVATTAPRRSLLSAPSTLHLDRLVGSGQVLRAGGGPAVEQAQQLLGAHGFNPGPVDGIMWVQRRARRWSRSSAVAD